MINSKIDILSQITSRTTNSWEEGYQKLAQDKDLLSLIKKVGRCKLWDPNLDREPSISSDELFRHLVRTVVSQQLHLKAAAKIQNKLESVVHELSPSSILELDHDVLREVGLSFAKIRSLTEISEAFLKDPFWNQRSIKADTQRWEEELLKLRGIGPWSKDIILLEALHLSDIIPYHDFGLRKAWQNIKHLDDLPTPEILLQNTQQYSPFRTLLSWYLWESLSLD